MKEIKIKGFPKDLKFDEKFVEFMKKDDPGCGLCAASAFRKWLKKYMKKQMKKGDK